MLGVRRASVTRCRWRFSPWRSPAARCSSSRWRALSVSRWRSRSRRSSLFRERSLVVLLRCGAWGRLRGPGLRPCSRRSWCSRARARPRRHMRSSRRWTSTPRRQSSGGTSSRFPSCHRPANGCSGPASGRRCAPGLRERVSGRRATATSRRAVSSSRSRYGRRIDVWGSTSRPRRPRCGNGAPTGGRTSRTSPGTTATPATPAAVPTPTPPPSPGATKSIVVEGFLTPESVLHDPAQDIYFVSNINGGPTTKDNNGFISRVRPDGAVENLKFIEGGHGGVTLNAPKGLAIRGDTLWVADIDMVRSFDAKTGAPRDSVSLAGLGAVFLNDIAIAQTGALYITDTGIRFDDVGNVLHPGPDRIFRIGTDRQVTVAVRGDT